MNDSARMARAKQLGFDILVYHGTKANFSEFDLEKGKPSVMGGYAPHFSASHAEANGYKKEAGRGAKLLQVLLRVNNPLIISFSAGVGNISPAEYQRITGKEWDSTHHPTGRKALDAILDSFGWEDHRANWTNAYRVLKQKGFDALYYPDVMGDHSSGTYGKYVVFDPRNIRLMDAAFDPSKSQSADLMA